jgi:Sad1 / UNC-like C-terminal
MVSFSALPTTLLAFLLAAPVFASQTTPFDAFQALSAQAPIQPDPPMCRLKPLPALETVEDEVLLSFEEWKVKQFAMQKQAKAKAKEKDAANRSTHANTAGGTVSSSGNGSEPSSIASDASTSVDWGSIPQDTAEGHSDEMLSPHFRVPLTDRFNYASLDCSARVHMSHRSAKSPSSILSSKKDRYMLGPCATSKHESQFVVVELCDDIRIDTVQLANFEFFSGVFKDFTVSVAKTYTSGWTVAGTYKAKNVRGVQVRLFIYYSISEEFSRHSYFYDSRFTHRRPSVTFIDTFESTFIRITVTNTIVLYPFFVSMG